MPKQSRGDTCCPGLLRRRCAAPRNDVVGTTAFALRASAVLAVSLQEVVPGQTEAADGCAFGQASMWPVPVVTVKPDRELAAALIRVFEGGGVGLLAQRGLDKALGLSVGLGRVGLGSQVFDAEARTCASEVFCPIA